MGVDGRVRPGSDGSGPTSRGKAGGMVSSGTPRGGPPSRSAGPGPAARLSSRRSLIRKVYGVDPLVCPGCGGTMKILAVIDRPAIVWQTLDHLGLPAGTASLRAPPDPPDQPRAWLYEPLG